MQSALDICNRNNAGAKAKDEAARAKLRADFPFAVQMVAELTGPDPRPSRAHLPAFKPRVISMTEGDKTWSR